MRIGYSCRTAFALITLLVVAVLCFPEAQSQEGRRGKRPSRRITNPVHPQRIPPPDLVAAEPGQAKVLLENERVRVLEVRVGVGQKQAMHSHPDHLVYPLSAYRVKHIAADGSATVGERRSGEVVWIPAETHAGENVGDTEIHVLIVELKETPREGAPQSR